jgi:hypothetical protein
MDFSDLSGFLGNGSDTGIRQQQIQKSSKTEELLAFSFT